MSITLKVLKYFLFFFFSMIILSLVPDVKMDIDDKIITSISSCTLYSLFELFSPSYVIYYEKKKISSKQ